MFGIRLICFQTDFIFSEFNTKYKIHGYLAHDWAPQGIIRWYIYVIRDVPCGKVYCGSSQSPVARFSQHRSTCNNPHKQKHGGTGLCNHFKQGCPNDTGRDKGNLNLTLVDYIDTSPEKLRRVDHVKGPQCKCSECARLKNLEDFHIMRLGTVFGRSGLNQRDEIKNKNRCQW